jgi:hypothetical protein
MKFLSWWGISGCFSNSVDDMCYQWSFMVQGRFQNLSWQLLFSCIVWNLWLHRNDVIFNDATLNFQSCFSLILRKFSLWLKLDNISSGSTSVDTGISNVVIFYGENRSRLPCIFFFFCLVVFSPCFNLFACLFFCSNCCLLGYSLFSHNLNTFSTII